ncbi:tripartite tricarboxylate transporter permease [Salipiger pacificus]|uniref:Tripartite tricarboxylate transporter permease n=2 Tax=Salipiger mangrovisoli TaxID=2865933 RepID=A0ABR9X7S9_9RHOB|nr:tripartite tricarboxylate transporter permease [Salipiger mangrovisoli]
MLFSVFGELLTPTTLVVILIANMVGIVFGAIPGLSGGIGVALLLPMTFGLSPVLAFAMLISVWVGGQSGAMIGSILLGIPGSPSAVATTFDGFPMTQRGEAVRALGAAISASFIGTFFSILIAAVLSDWLADFAVQLGPWEYFALGMCAISLVSSLSSGGVLHGFAAAALGLLASTVGFAPIDGSERFTFGSIYMGSGFDLIALMLGLFAIKQIVTEFARGLPTFDQAKIGAIKGLGVSFAEYRANGVNILRSFMIGLWIGFLPGMGAALSNLVAYAQAKNSSKHPEKFGTGCIDGVFASETANNASIGGSLIPMISLGIPGDGTTALLLGGLMIHGLQPGPLLFSSNPEIVLTIFMTALISAVLVLALQFGGIRLFPYILRVPHRVMYPAIVVLCFTGTFVYAGTEFNFLFLVGFALLGILMDWFRLPISPFPLAFILGPMLELNLRNSLTYDENGLMMFVTRPVAAGLLLIALCSILWPFFKPRRAGTAGVPARGAE